MSRKDKDKYIYVMPVAGGAIVNHMAFLAEVYDARVQVNNGKRQGYFSYAPHIVLGSSAGNVAAFMGQASDWQTENMERNVKLMNSSLFMTKWVPKSLSLIPDIPFALMKGSLYNKGCGAKEMFDTLFTSEKIQRSEMWLGTYDIESKKAQFFCNRSQATAEISDSFFNEEQPLYNAMPLIFTDGDVEMLCNVSLASATIPATVPPQEINGHFYADGGVMYASPLSVLHKEIARIITGKERVPISRSFNVEKDTINNIEITYQSEHVIEEKNLRMFYFFPYQPNGLIYDSDNKDLGIRSYLDSILNVAMIQDRNTAIELLNFISPEGLETETYMKMNTNELTKILKFLNKRKHYVICLFPHLNPSIPISHINGTAMLNAMNHTRHNYGCQIWYSKRLVD